MRKILFSVVALISCVSLAAGHVSLIKGNRVPTNSQQDVVIKTEKVAGNVYVLFGQGGNIGVSVGKDGILMIDDQFERLADKIKAALKELGSDKPRFLFNTHWHGDHTGGNTIFGADSIIVAHTNVRTRLSTTVKQGDREIKALPPVGLPMITIKVYRFILTAKKCAPCIIRTVTRTATRFCISRRRTSFTWAIISSPGAFRSSI
jgi:hypothetical protein